VVDAQLWFSPVEVVLTFPQVNRGAYLPFPDIVNIFPRRYYQLNTAIELLLRDGTSYFLDFAPISNTEIFGFLTTCTCERISMRELARQWSDAKLSNFLYLMNLNIVAGRSFDDFLQWPIFPNLFSGRDLARPLKQIEPLWDIEIDALFGESVLTPLDIDRILFRLEPFTTHHLRVNGRLLPDSVCKLEDLAMTELPAECYFQPEIFVAKDGLPSFTLSERPFDFVYGLRKLLESDEVSVRIAEWIDQIFGCRQRGPLALEIGNLFHPCVNTSHHFVGDDRLHAVMTLFGVMPMQLFDEPHLVRRSISRLQSETWTHTCSLVPLVFAGRVAGGDVWLVDATGRISAIRIDLIQPTHFENRNCPDATLPKDSVCAIVGVGLIAYDPISGKLQSVGLAGDCQKEMIGLNDFVGDGTKFATVRNRTVLQLFDVETVPDPTATAVSTEDVIECLAMSTTFHVLCTITRDDTLHLFSLKGLQQTAAVKLPRSSARRMLITPSWGFIAVDFGKDIVVFSINGELLTEYSHNCQFAYLGAIRSPDEFDYFVYSDLKGNLEICEVYKPENRAQLAQLVWPVCFVFYERECDTLIIISTTGKIMLIKHPFTQLPKSS
jgi:hypothetical protein